MSVYLDNAATTPLDPRVFEAMKPYMLEKFGNPSSIHSHGREMRSAIEKARKKVADLLGTSPAEIFFTSGGTEADNTVLRLSTEIYGIRHVISSPIEHHAVIHTLEAMEKAGDISLHLVDLDDKGHVDYRHLEKLLEKYPGALVSLMHANNEIGNLTDIQQVGELCAGHAAWFHSDTVQTIGYYPINLQEIQVNAVAASAHKFHGPKGIGFMYINGDKPLKPFLIGGGQERNMRGGTENVYGIIGLARALELAHEEMEISRAHIEKLKEQTMAGLKNMFSSIHFYGDSSDMNNSHYKVLNAGIPGQEDNDMLLFNLDIQGISVSGGSACASGTSIGSHVLEALNTGRDMGAIRISFSKNNTEGEIDKLIATLKVLLD